MGIFVWSYIDNVSAINAFKNRYGLLELDIKQESEFRRNRHTGFGTYWQKAA